MLRNGRREIPSFLFSIVKPSYFSKNVKHCDFLTYDHLRKKPQAAMLGGIAQDEIMCIITITCYVFRTKAAKMSHK